MRLFRYLIPAIVACHAACTGHVEKIPQADSIALAAITDSSFARYVRTLSADEFEGRKPFTRGDDKTVNYLRDEFSRLGLLPGNAGSFFQEVPMVEVTSRPAGELILQGTDKRVTLRYLDDFVIGSMRQETDIRVEATELVFAGFGIVAPEYGWNDYAGVDVRGKTVVVMVNDPGYYDKSLFKGDTMTYYGRWTYKYEEAARQGADGVLIIHDTGPASYGWNVVRSGWSGPQLDLQSDDKGVSRCTFEGWLTAASARKLFELAGVPDSLPETAKKSGFKAVSLKAHTSVSIQNTFRESASNNVLAQIKGSKRPDEYIIYTAHWDHLGIGEPVDSDSIYNGALDNASGLAALFEIAKAFKAAPIPPERSILFLAVTAEEEGLLGSKWYAAHPVYPLAKTAANINIDALSPAGRTTDVTIVGIGQSELDDYVAYAAGRQGRTVSAPANPSSGGFYRSDHFNFAKAGVPALYMGSGRMLTGKDSTETKAARDRFASIYHHPKDEFSDAWQLDGMIEDIQLLFDVGYRLSRERSFPVWKAGSEFKEIGEKR